jgi:CRP-like cAMP-binding protein
MAADTTSVRGNKLLAFLPADDLDQIRPHLEPVHLIQGALLGEEGQSIDHVYFLTEGICSVIARTPDGARAEAGIFGFDGYIPTSAIADVDVYTYDVYVQLDSRGYRISYDHFRRLMDGRRNLFKVMIRAIEAFAVQLAYTAVSNAVHDVNERLARWLLMCDDRIVGNELPLTHEFISMMLAVRRPSVTTALHVLEGNGFIKAERGLVTIRDRKRLEEFAADAYGKPEQAYERLMRDLF